MRVQRLRSVLILTHVHSDGTAPPLVLCICACRVAAAALLATNTCAYHRPRICDISGGCGCWSLSSRRRSSSAWPS